MDSNPDTEPRKRRATRPVAPTASRGHMLFEAWLCRRYGASPLTSRPHWRGMRAFAYDLNRAVESKQALAQATAIYEWLATAIDPKVPRTYYREAIAALSGGTVPSDAWAESAQAAA